MTYIPSLNKIQIGLEAALHDAAVDTIEPVGVLDFRVNSKNETEQIPDKRGDTMPAWDAFIKRRWSEGTLEGYLDYERFYIYLDGMFGKATPAGNDRTYLADLDWDAAVVEQSLSFRYGQTGLLYLAAGVLPYDMTISGGDGNALKYKYNFFAGAITDGATFAAVAVDTPDWAMSTTTALYIDAGVGATVGTTPIADIAFRFEWSPTSNRKPIWHLGDQVWDSYINGKWGGSLKLVLEADATNLAQLGDIIDATTTPEFYAIRLRTTDGSNTLDLDFAGTPATPPVLITDLDGVVTVELDLVPHYNTTMLSCWGAKLTIA